MKKVTAFVTILLIVTAMLCSCGGSAPTLAKNSGKLSVVTTIFPYYDFVKNITGSSADIKLLVPPGVEPHDFDVSPSDIIAVNDADLFIYTGGESDVWVDSILNTLDSSVRVMRLMDYIEPVMVEGGHHHESGNTGDIDGYAAEAHADTEGELEPDEHIWTSPENAITITTVISEEIKRCDPENSELYEINADEYLSELKSLDESFKSIAENGKRNLIVFGDRFPIAYLADELSLDYECAFPGCSHETEPGISTVVHLIDVVRENDIPVVFYLDFSNGAVANLLCEDSNARPLVYHSCHNVTAGDFNRGASYIELMKENAAALKEALN